VAHEFESLVAVCISSQDFLRPFGITIIRNVNRLAAHKRGLPKIASFLSVTWAWAAEDHAYISLSLARTKDGMATRLVMYYLQNVDLE
jgi:hypothetical protein